MDIMWTLLLRCVTCSAIFGVVYNLEIEKITVCDKRPSGTKMPQTKADGRFFIDVVGPIGKKYLPHGNYTVQLRAKDGATFASFLIMADGEYIQDKTNSRKHKYLEPGTLNPIPGSPVPTQMHPFCKNSVQHSDNTPKNFVEVQWIAPRKDQGCVSIHAMVAESQDVWYMDDGPLTYRLCEDVRKIIDIEPIVNEKCSLCEEAKYELTFEGQWCRNTHPRNFPIEANRRFSDLVGASHSSKFYLWDYDVKATDGLKLLAEAGNTTLLEQEIYHKFGQSVRTLIKASGRSGDHMSEPTSAIFRADRVHHLISIATSLVPSPDWFLGVTHFELCLQNNTWVQDRELNLYLIDAGTDNGVSYESSNEETLPPGSIKRIRERTDYKNSPFYSENPTTPRHFAKIRVQLLRVYKEFCDKERGHGDKRNIQSPEQTPTITNSVGSRDSEEECRYTDWQEWSECSPECGAQRQRYRERYSVINGVTVTYSREGIASEIPEKCTVGVQFVDAEPCPAKECS